MKEFADNFQKKHPKIAVAEDIEIWTDEDEDGNEIDAEQVSYNINSSPGLDNLTLNLKEEEEFSQLDAIIQSKPTLFVDFLGGKFGPNVEVVLTKISRGLFHPPPPTRNLKALLSYRSAEITVTLTSNRTDKSNVGFIAQTWSGLEFRQIEPLRRCPV